MEIQTSEVKGGYINRPILLPPKNRQQLDRDRQVSSNRKQDFASSKKYYTILSNISLEIETEQVLGISINCGAFKDRSMAEVKNYIIKQ